MVHSSQPGPEMGHQKYATNDFIGEFSGRLSSTKSNRRKGPNILTICYRLVFYRPESEIKDHLRCLDIAMNDVEATEMMLDFAPWQIEN